MSGVGFLPASFIIFAAVTAFMVFLMNKTKFGNRIYSIGGNLRAAKFSGINTAKWKAIAFAFSGLCVGIAALLYCSRMQSIETVQGSGYEMTSIAIAVIGGTTMDGGRGKLENSFIASIILAMVLNLMSLRGLVSWYQTMFIGVIIVAAAIQHAYQYRKADMATGDILGKEAI
jgi:ribose/xylose/arabinose/galactoside ABC-type transport system permease subunit